MVDFLCIGAHKSGTSWLDDNLKRHPDVWTPLYKELHFFDELEFGRRINEDKKRKRWLSNYLHHLSTKVINGKTINRKNLDWALNFVQTPNNKRNIKWYGELFIDSRHMYKKVGESTPAYALLSRATYKKIYNLNNNIKIIFIIRNPALRDWSSLRFDLMTYKKLSDNKNKIKTPDLDKDTIYNYLSKKNVENRSNYLQTMKRVESIFPKENIKYLFFDQIESGPNELMEDICDFLDIDFLLEYFPNLSKKRLVSKEIDMDDDILNYLKEKYRGMVEEIDQEHIRIPGSWKSFFDL
ncbi:sulfotransferase domain-containing protein [Sulfurovum sp. NBC37-1]|uniref:sulfotransferase domain-containing protein n=1 Tax=Sulfurovum sp. (strain NBC37-1) TaxID=387093 RepID=UPI0001587964|nr:sulfotransferase domain-containing protein [Sulfurovum sp. NBC37-1]BAF72678.1 conserved hypothetical protein [Sulfurovum sp. NBC37-1]